MNNEIDIYFSQRIEAAICAASDPQKMFAIIGLLPFLRVGMIEMTKIADADTSAKMYCTVACELSYLYGSGDEIDELLSSYAEWIKNSKLLED